MTYPLVARIEIPVSGPVKAVVARAKAYYSRASQARLPAGAIEVDIAFPTPLRDTNWVPIGFSFMNVADAVIDIVFIQVVAITVQSQSGFTVLLSAPPPTDNYYLNWGIAEITNP